MSFSVIPIPCCCFVCLSGLYLHRPTISSYLSTDAKEILWLRDYRYTWMYVCVCVCEQLSILVQFKNSWSTQGQFVDTQVHVLISDMVPLTWITCFNYGTFQSFPPPSWLVRELSSEDQVYRHFKGCGRWQSVFYPWLITWPRPAPVKHVPAAGGFLKIVIYLFFKYTQSNVHREKIQ